MLLERALAILRAAAAADAAGWSHLLAPLAPLEAAVATVREVVLLHSRYIPVTLPLHYRYIPVTFRCARSCWT